jgi:hypothetical protein
MGFEIAIVAVGLTRKQAFEFAPLRLGVELSERGLGFLDDVRVALRVAELYELDRLLDLVGDALVAADRAVKPGALAQRSLRRPGVIPQLRVFGFGVQLGEAAVGWFPVKDASSAAPTTC